MNTIGFLLTGIGADDMWYGPNPLWLSLFVTVAGVVLIFAGVLRRT